MGEVNVSEMIGKPEEITMVLKKIAELCEAVLKWSDADHMSYRLIKEDTAALRQQKLQIVNEIDELKNHIVDMKKNAAAIIENAKKDADKIIVMAREHLAIASKTRKEADTAKEEGEAYARMKLKELEKFKVAVA